MKKNLELMKNILEFTVSKSILKERLEKNPDLKKEVTVIVESEDGLHSVHPYVGLMKGIKIETAERITFVKNGKCYEYVACSSNGSDL